MTQNLNKVKNSYQVVIIGGGITGAGLFRDLSLQGIDVLLVDKKDFSSQTSQSSSKMLHGGIRYLENFDFALVYEALHEKNLWLKVAPHLCYEQGFFLPIYKNSKRPLWMIKIGLALYDFLSGYQNTPHKIITKKQTLESLIGLRKEGLSGAGIYYDAIVDDAKLTLENIFDGERCKNAQAISHVEVSKLEMKNNKAQVHLRDCLDSSHKIIQTEHVIIATGPFTDKLIPKITEFNWQNQLLPSKGSHLWLKKDALKLSRPLVLNTKDNRIIFVIPQEKGILIGTTEVQIKSNFFDIKPDQKEIDYLISSLNEYFPESQLKSSHILSTFAGIRPLVKEEGVTARGKTARHHKVFRPHQKVHVILGGKYTTFRKMGQEISREITMSFGKTYREHLTLSPFKTKSIIYSQKDINPKNLKLVLEKEYPRTFEDLVIRRLGIPSKKHWNLKISFDDFFLQEQKLLSSFFPFDEKILANFPI